MNLYQLCMKVTNTSHHDDSFNVSLRLSGDFSYMMTLGYMFLLGYLISEDCFVVFFKTYYRFTTPPLNDEGSLRL